ncbi:DUF1653 domain-containing protein [Marinobacter subterrani]|uniref:DUF1653 domain-containing protein n=1 Tax=Marinobacter subterrani TaxID=1658765 RepID=A0A0J7J3T8_9GAMM|nr:DUF1653 domain-containing protein [Marinobacter subterrani]KMQ72887.1 Protein of unknown function (DUF1653) [Marinobacter subterrani]
MTDRKSEIRPGRYRHYKGKDYEVLGIARHSETEEQMVVYRCLYGDHSLWVRPLAMFRETVEVAGEQVPRFARLDEK